MPSSVLWPAATIGRVVGSYNYFWSSERCEGCGEPTTREIQYDFGAFERDPVVLGHLVQDDPSGGARVLVEGYGDAVCEQCGAPAPAYGFYEIAVEGSCLRSVRPWRDREAFVPELVALAGENRSWIYWPAGRAFPDPSSA